MWASCGLPHRRNPAISWRRFCLSPFAFVSANYIWNWSGFPLIMVSFHSFLFYCRKFCLSQRSLNSTRLQPKLIIISRIKFNNNTEFIRRRLPWSRKLETSINRNCLIAHANTARVPFHRNHFHPEIKVMKNVLHSFRLQHYKNFSKIISCRWSFHRTKEKPSESSAV